MGALNRRTEPRIPLQMPLVEVVDDRLIRSMTFNIGPSGLYVSRLTPLWWTQRRVVSLEFALPQCDELIWARGEVRFDMHDAYFHGTGIAFTGMASKHERMIQDYVDRHREAALRELLANIRRNRLN